MNRIINYHITDEYHNLSILQFFKRKSYTDKAIITLKKTPEGILLNGVWAYVNQKLSSGDIVTVNIIENGVSENILPENIALEIIYEDEDLLVVNKPADMPVHPSLNHYTGTLANAVTYYFVSQNKPYVFRCVNRLDKDTSGLTILPKHQLAGGILSDMVSKRLVKRIYLCLCSDDGSLPLKGTIDAPIARKGDSIIERTVDFQKGERAVTHFTKLAHHPSLNISLIQLQLETGRTHQIRVHMSYIGHPLLGDEMYGGDCSLIHRQALHSYSLEFIHPITGEEMYFVQELPEDIQKIINVTEAPISHVPGTQPSSAPSEGSY